jgi:hypothetical protein
MDGGREGGKGLSFVFGGGGLFWLAGGMLDTVCRRIRILSSATILLLLFGAYFGTAGCH